MRSDGTYSLHLLRSRCQLYVKQRSELLFAMGARPGITWWARWDYAWVLSGCSIACSGSMGRTILQLPECGLCLD